MTLNAWYLPGLRCQSRGAARTCSDTPDPFRSWVLVLSLTFFGCGDPRAPAAPGRDAGPLGDAARADAASIDGSSGRRDGGPVLPPADIEVVLPFGGPEETARIEVTADLARLDVAFSIDTTGSFGQEIDELQDALEDRVVPTLRARVDDVGFAVSRFEDMPDAPFGEPSDHPFELLTPVTTYSPRVASAVASLDEPLGHGGDAPESGAEALYQIATGEGYRTTRAIVPAYTGSGLGGVGFREGAFRVVVHATDAPTHAPEDYGTRFPRTRSVREAADALSAIGARVVGVASGEPARAYLETLALATGATIAPEGGVCATGVAGAPRDPVSGVCPMVFGVAADGRGLSDTIVDAIVALVDGVAYGEVYGEAVDDPLSFVRAIEATEATVPDGTPAPAIEDRRAIGDGYLDTFVEVRTRTELVFVVHFLNTTLPPADYDQVFRLRVQIRGDDLLLAERRVRVVIPRGRLDAGPPPLDAGAPPGDAGEPDAAPVDGAPDA